MGGSRTLAPWAAFGCAVENQHRHVVTGRLVPEMPGERLPEAVDPPAPGAATQSPLQASPTEGLTAGALGLGKPVGAQHDLARGIPGELVVTGDDL